MYVCVG